MAAGLMEDGRDDESSFEDSASDEGESDHNSSDTDDESPDDDESYGYDGNEGENDVVLPDADSSPTSIGVSDTAGGKAICENSASVFPSQVPLGESSEVPMSDPSFLLSAELLGNVESDDNSQDAHDMIRDSAADLATRLIDMKRHQGVAVGRHGKIIDDHTVVAEASDVSVPEDSTASVKKISEESMILGKSGEKRKEASKASEVNIMECDVNDSGPSKRFKVDEVLPATSFSNRNSKREDIRRVRQRVFKRQATRFSPRLAGLRSAFEPGSSRMHTVASPTVNVDNVAGDGRAKCTDDSHRSAYISSVGASPHRNPSSISCGVDVPVAIQRLAQNFVERRSMAGSNECALQEEIEEIESDGFSVKEGVLSVFAEQGHVMTTPTVDAIKAGAPPRIHTNNELGNCAGMFTPPGFDLGIDFSSPAHSTSPEQGAVLDYPPLAWAPPIGLSADGVEVMPSTSTDGHYDEMNDAFEMNEAFAAALDEIEREFEASKGSQVAEAKESKSSEVSSWQAVEETQRLACKASIRESAGEIEGGRDSKAAVEEVVIVDDSQVYGRSSTPKDQPHKERVKMPSKYKLSPYDMVSVSSEQEDVYRKVLGSCKNARGSKIKKVKIIQYESMWVYTEEFAESVKPRGELSNNMGEIGISYVSHHHKKEKKIVFSYLVARYLLEGNLAKKFVKDQFARERTGEKLSCQELIMFPVLQKLGRGKDDPSHWYVLVLNLVARRFEILDSLRDGSDKVLMEHASEIMLKIKEAWLIYYGQSKVQIAGYKLVCIETTKQDNPRDCGFFMVKFLELWDGQNVPAVSAGQIPNIKKVLTHNWLSSELNTIKNWKHRLDNNA